MAIWYEIEHSKKGIENFLNCTGYLHDYRVERMEYVPSKSLVEMFCKYDTDREGVLLRFVDVGGVHIRTDVDYRDAWTWCATVVVEKNQTLSFFQSDEDVDWEAKKEPIYDTYVNARRIMFAITDKDGKPVEMPENRMDFTVHNSFENTDTEYHLTLQEFTERWEDILKLGF